MDDKDIGRRIIQLRNKRDLTTTELARMVGISQAQISRLENGKQGFRSATLSKIAEALNVDVVYFFIDERHDQSERIQIYGSIAHPKLADAIKSPKFMELCEQIAAAYGDNMLLYNKMKAAVETVAQG